MNPALSYDYIQEGVVMSTSFESNECRNMNPFHDLSPLLLLKYVQTIYTGISAFEIPRFRIGIVNCPLEFPPGQHVHSDYEFMIPMKTNMLTASGHKKIRTKKEHILALNSGQDHGPGNTRDLLDGFINISCDEELLNKISKEVLARDRIIFRSEDIEFSNDTRLILSLLIEEKLNIQTGSDFLLENLVNSFLTYILRNASPNHFQDIHQLKKHSDRRMEQINDFLRENYNKDFSLAELSQLAGLSPYHFIRVFKKHFNKTPYDYLLDLKVEKAKQMLAKENINITEVCFSCGFNNSSHFSAVFKRRTGLSPSQYRHIINGRPIF